MIHDRHKARNHPSSVRPLRVIHLSVMRRLSHGQRKQLQQERAAARELKHVRWRTIALHDEPAKTRMEWRVPVALRYPVIRSLYWWWYALRLSKRCDFLVMRHAPFDILGALASLLIRNRVSVHHSREVEELPLIRPGLLGRSLAVVERLVGGSSIRSARAVLGVTREIARYEVDRAQCPSKPHFVYPNSIVVRHTEVLQDARRPDLVEACFMCGRFSPWHGLDLLLCDASRNYQHFAGRLRIHLIGNLSDEDRLCASGFDRLFELHGLLDEVAFRRVLASCDIGIGSLALSRQGMSQGSTLKMCEMLAMGLPVYVGEPDVVLPPDFPFSRVTRSPSLEGILAFGEEMKSVNRAAIRNASKEYIEKARWMREAVEFLYHLRDGA